MSLPDVWGALQLIPSQCLVDGCTKPTKHQGVAWSLANQGII